MPLVTNDDVCHVNNSVAVNTFNIWQINPQQLTGCSFLNSLFLCLSSISKSVDDAKCHNNFNKSRVKRAAFCTDIKRQQFLFFFQNTFFVVP